jgi:hypothetical protein
VGRLPTFFFGLRVKAGTVGLILLGAASLLPTVLVDIPAMLDYLDHLARMYVVTDFGTANENPYYEVLFALYPDLAMDLAVPQLARFMSVESATRLFLLFAQVLVITGAIVLEWVIKGRHEVAGFAALLTLPSIGFSLGFVNFEFGLGIALFGIAGWIRWEHRKWYVRFAVHAFFVIVLFVAHLFALCRSFRYLACNSNGADTCRARFHDDGNCLPNWRGNWGKRKRMVVQLEADMARSVPQCLRH